MSKVIEILDSDDDSAKQSIRSSVEHASETGSPKSDARSTQVAAEQQDAEKNKTKNRRKAVHQVIRTNPEMQFQTIIHDEKDNRKRRRKNLMQTMPTAVKSDIPAANVPVVAAVAAAAIDLDAALLLKAPTVQEVLIAACDELLHLEEADEMLRSIAENRIRINFLLNACGMKEMQFTQGTDMEHLKLQLAQRMQLKRELTRAQSTAEDQEVDDEAGDDEAVDDEAVDDEAVDDEAVDDESVSVHSSQSDKENTAAVKPRRRFVV